MQMQLGTYNLHLDLNKVWQPLNSLWFKIQSKLNERVFNSIYNKLLQLIQFNSNDLLSIGVTFERIHIFNLNVFS